MDNESLNSLIAGVGAICEMAALIRDNLMRNGFTREEAVMISSRFLETTFKQAANDAKGE